MAMEKLIVIVESLFANDVTKEKGEKMKKIGRMEFVGKFEDTSDLLTMPFLPGIDACISIYKENANGQFKKGRMNRNSLSTLGIPDTDEARRTIFLSFLGNITNDEASNPFLYQMPFGEKLPVLSLNKKELKKAITEEGFCFCSNQMIEYGASAIFAPGVLEKIGDAIGDFYIIPSSVHEVMILEVDVAPSIPVILNTIQEMNYERDCIKEREILSDSLYFYNAKTRKVTEIKE